MTPILHNSGSYNKTREKMNQEDHNKTEKNLITLLNWYRLKRVNEFAAQCDEAQAWESIQQRIPATVNGTNVHLLEQHCRCLPVNSSFQFLHTHRI